MSVYIFWKSSKNKCSSCVIICISSYPYLASFNKYFQCKSFLNPALVYRGTLGDWNRSTIPTLNSHETCQLLTKKENGGVGLWWEKHEWQARGEHLGSCFYIIIAYFFCIMKKQYIFNGNAVYINVFFFFSVWCANHKQQVSWKRVMYVVIKTKLASVYLIRIFI